MSNERYDVDSAVAYLTHHAHLSSSGRCAEYVRKALAAGGIVVPQSEATRYAKTYGPVLLALGFDEVPANELILPHKGDIAVIQPYPNGNVAGHIAMFSGTRWISDFSQRDMWGGPGYRQYKPAYRVFRKQGDR